MNNTYDVFISYNTKDEQIAQDLNEILRKNDIKAYLYSEKSILGNNFLNFLSELYETFN